jgi:hypothetical protein
MPQLTTDDFVRLVTLYVPETVTALSFSPDGSLIAVAAGDKVHLFIVPPQAKGQAITPSSTTNSNTA